MSKQITMTVDGQKITTEKDKTILQVLGDNGISIPSLCHHPSLEPNGACRLCTVEIGHQRWPQWSSLVTSCNYKVEEGLKVFTRSLPVTKLRQTLLELYLTQHPETEKIRLLAQSEGVDTTSFQAKKNNNNCVLCGLCTRVCQDLGPAVIAPFERGIMKRIAPRPNDYGEDCTGCTTCSHICPTKAIPIKHENQTLTIWNREFSLPICSVKPEYCRGCGICEEVCPLAIPKVTLSSTGNVYTRIAPHACIGCGICAGACPTGAITQKMDFSEELENFSKDQNLQGQTIAFACSRSPFPDKEKYVIPVSCVGRVGVDIILTCLARGADRVVLICRDRDSCPYRNGGMYGEKVARVADKISVLTGLGSNRIMYIKPPADFYGPSDIYAKLHRERKPTPLKKLYTGNVSPGFDHASNLVSWLQQQPELNPCLPPSLQSLFNPEPEDNATYLYLGNLPELSLLFSLLIDPNPIVKLIKEAIQVLNLKNIKIIPVITEAQVNQGIATKVIVFSRYKVPQFSRQLEVITLDELVEGDPDRLDEEMVSDFQFRISQNYRRKLIDFLKTLPRSIRCSSPQSVAQLTLLLRQGSWQLTSRKEASMAFSQFLTKDVAEKKSQSLDKTGNRVKEHPIIPEINRPFITFSFNNKTLTARQGEALSSALYANGIAVFGHHHRDGRAQGIFCVNGQCSQCMVIADGKPVKSCMTPVTQDMQVQSCEGLPALTDDEKIESSPEIKDHKVEVLIIGGGPSGISAAIELGRLGVQVLLIDDKQELGGKLSLQTHNFFGSVTDCYAGTRGNDIGKTLTREVSQLASVTIWTQATVVGVFTDKKFGVACQGKYHLVSPESVLIATGAREKSLSFPGCDLPGVYGAGAFQTLVNRDLIHCAQRLFIIGGGNVGLIGAYHALQAGIDVVCVVEALPQCGGYKVHEDKIKRLGVPVKTSHTVLRIEGKDRVEKVVIAAIDQNFKPLAGTEESYEVDTVLIAVGLSPVDELLHKAKEYGFDVYAAGDSKEIAEASAAIFSGKIVGRQIARDRGLAIPIPSNWSHFSEMLKHKPSASVPFVPRDYEAPVYPLIRCVQEIPCDPCVKACPKNLISMAPSILSLPVFHGECLGCGRCVLACPGLAITLVINDYDHTHKRALIMVPFELTDKQNNPGMEVTTTDIEGNPVGKARIIAVRQRKSQNRRKFLLLEVPEKDKLLVAGIRIRTPIPGDNQVEMDDSNQDDPIVCRCERIRKSEIVKQIRQGVRNMNELKSVTRAGLGGCSGKTCKELVLRIFREQGIELPEITLPTIRPLVAEIHLQDFSQGGNSD